MVLSRLSQCVKQEKTFWQQRRRIPGCENLENPITIGFLAKHTGLAHQAAGLVAEDQVGIFYFSEEQLPEEAHILSTEADDLAKAAFLVPLLGLKVVSRLLPINRWFNKKRKFSATPATLTKSS